ncbi:MAG: TIGR02302 family protein [Rhodospirillales bacterium]|nr:MAG: TIGR02302 family protein [Rhodospirillales bacterium]
MDLRGGHRGGEGDAVSSGQDRRYRRLLRLAKGALLWERVWPRAWPFAAVVGGFVTLALLDILPALPGWAHGLILVGFGGAAAVALYRTLSALGPVGRDAARRRIEIDSGLHHRPLAALEDRLAAGCDAPGGGALWQRHRQRMAEAVSRIRVRWPAPDVASRDPWALRAVVVLLLVIGVAAGGHEAGPRLARAVAPDLTATATDTGRIDVWISPPAYTGLAPVLLTARDGSQDGLQGEPLPVPVGSSVLAQAGRLPQAPVLLLGADRVPFASVTGSPGPVSDYRAETVVEGGSRLTVELRRRTLASWPIRVIADEAPEIAFAAPPDSTPDGLLALSYRATDDYGVVGVTATLERTAAQTGEDASLQLKLPVPPSGQQSVSGHSHHDLTAHPWAGFAVTIRLEAVDAAGQRGVSEPVAVQLPERSFSHPVARAVIAERRRLTDSEPEIRQGVAAVLERIAGRPDLFADDVVVSLALAVARSRLIAGREPAAVSQVRDILWQTALRIELGRVPMAERRLHEAHDAVAEALQRDADVAELDSLIDDLQGALEEYLAAVADALAERGLTADAEAAPWATMMAGADLMDVVETMRQLAQSGARAGAEAMLADLQRLLERLRAGLSGGDGAAAAEFAEAGRLMRELGALAERQQTLLDQTFASLRDAQGWLGEGAPGTASQGGAPEAAEQEALRRALGELMLDLDSLLGGIPEPLGSAERAMGNAVVGLKRHDLESAVESQGEALAHLQSSLSAAAEAMAERFGPGAALLLGGAGMMQPGPGSDPFGRFGGGTRGFGTGDVAVPEEGEIRRAQEVLRELRRRAGEAHRARDELDYIQRLLRLF